MSCLEDDRVTVQLASHLAAACRALEALGVQVEPSQAMTAAGGFDVPCPPRVVLQPSFACTFQQLKRHFPTPKRVSVSQRSTLVITGPGSITVKQLQLDGALRISAAQGAVVGAYKTL